MARTIDGLASYALHRLRRINDAELRRVTSSFSDEDALSWIESRMEIPSLEQIEVEECLGLRPGKESMAASLVMLISKISLLVLAEEKRRMANWDERYHGCKY